MGQLYVKQGGAFVEIGGGGGASLPFTPSEVSPPVLYDPNATAPYGIYDYVGGSWINRYPTGSGAHVLISTTSVSSSTLTAAKDALTNSGNTYTEISKVDWANLASYALTYDAIITSYLGMQGPTPSELPIPVLFYSNYNASENAFVASITDGTLTSTVNQFTHIGFSTSVGPLADYYSPGTVSTSTSYYQLTNITATYERWADPESNSGSTAIAYFPEKNFIYATIRSEISPPAAMAQAVDLLTNALVAVAQGTI